MNIKERSTSCNVIWIKASAKQNNINDMINTHNQDSDNVSHMRNELKL